MAGKKCTGTQTNNAGNSKNSRAFCEGRNYRGTGTGLQAPITDNPHEAGSEAADAWDRGWTAVDISSGTSVGVDGCCPAVGDVLP